MCLCVRHNEMLIIFTAHTLILSRWQMKKCSCKIFSVAINRFLVFVKCFSLHPLIWLNKVADELIMANWICRIGGAVPIVFSYFAEVLAREKRGEHLSWLCMFWMIGGIYASAMAWAIIPHYGEWQLAVTPMNHWWEWQMALLSVFPHRYQWSSLHVSLEMYQYSNQSILYFWSTWGSRSLTRSQIKADTLVSTFSFPCGGVKVRLGGL